MALFSRKTTSAASEPEDVQEIVETTPAPEGPFDIASVDSVDHMYDFGVLHLPKESGVRVQFTINKRTRGAMGALVQFAGSALTFNVYAAPKTAALWPDVRDELAESITSGGGTATFREGPFGPEVEAVIPKKDVNELRHVRYVGVDGPRWFLRVTIEGEAVTNQAARDVAYAYMKQAVVDRGSDPHPVRDLLELTMPEAAKTRVEAKLGKPAELKPRGPELPELV